MKPLDRTDAVERVRHIDPFARRLDGLSRAVSRPRRLRSILAGEPFGHSAHPMFVQLPIGACQLDCLSPIGHSAVVLTGVGIVSALPAVAAGLVDYTRLDQPRRRVATALALACQVASLREGRCGRLRRGQSIGLAGTATLTVGGLLGGHLAHRLSAPRLPARRPTPAG